MIMGDGLLGQMMEPVSFPDRTNAQIPENHGLLLVTKVTDRNIIHSLELQSERLEAHNRKLQKIC